MGSVPGSILDTLSQNPNNLLQIFNAFSIRHKAIKSLLGVIVRHIVHTCFQLYVESPM